MFVIFILLQSPVGQINMRDARVEQVDHVSDSDSEDNTAENAQLTIGIFPTHQGPTYLLMPTKQDKVISVEHGYYIAVGD